MTRLRAPHLVALFFAALPQFVVAQKQGRALDIDAFPISFCCGPPADFTTLERYREIKDPGFTFVMPPCAGVTPELNTKIHGGYRNLTEAELRFEAMQMLAYGGKGLIWFTYWSTAGIDHNFVWEH